MVLVEKSYSPSRCGVIERATENQMRMVASRREQA
jgi:hypothetical protein